MKETLAAEQEVEDAHAAATQDLATFEMRQAWSVLAREKASIVVASAGEANLTFVRCYKPERRINLLCKRLPSNPDLVAAVRCAMALAKDGCLPAIIPAQARSRREFLGRCVEAVKKVNPTAETDPKKLTVPEQLRLALALEVTARLCHKCNRPARDPVAASEICVTWVYDEQGGDQTAVPEAAAGKVFCAACANDGRILMCPQCGRDDALEHADHAWVSDIVSMGQYTTSTRCTRCSRSAVIIASRQDKRKKEIAEQLYVMKRLRKA